MSEGLPVPQQLQNNSIPLNTLVDGTDPNDVLTWDGTEWISTASGGGGTVLGTANQITANTVGETTTLSLANALITPGSLTTTTSITANNNLSIEGTSTLGASITPTNTNLFTANVYYFTGTVIQSGNTVTGFGTGFTSDMVGMLLVYNNGVSAGFITAVNSGNSLTVTTSQGVGSQTYKIYNYSLVLNSANNNVSIGNLASPTLFSVMPVNNTLTFVGTVSQSANIVTGVGTNFTSSILGMYLVYATGIYGGLITAVSSTTSMTVSTSQTIASTNYIIQYPGFQVNSTGQSILSGKALTTETINTSTTLNTYLDSIIDTTNGLLTCTLGPGIANQYKVIKLSTIKSSPAIISCVLGGGGTFQLNTTDYIRELRYDANVGYWQIEGGTSASIPTPTSFYPTTQQGTKLVGTGATGIAQQGYSCALSADGNTLAIGGYQDNSFIGATWIFIRNAGVWIQQGNKLIGTGATVSAYQGSSCALSADGNTLATGGINDNGGIGATWIFTRSGTVWTQQGAKLVGTGNTGAAQQGTSCALSADGNTLVTCGVLDNSSIGAAWIFTRTGTTWTQQGTKLVGTGNTGTSQQGTSCTLSADGNTLVIGGINDNTFIGATWVFTRSGTTWSQQGNKLLGIGSTGSPRQGNSCALSADGNTLAVGGQNDNTFVGATWIFTRSGTTWTQQGAKLVGTGITGSARQGFSCGLSADGNTLAIGGNTDNSNIGAAWIFTRTASFWTQRGTKLVGTGGTATTRQGRFCLLSANGNTLVVASNEDNSNAGAVWVFT